MSPAPSPINVNLVLNNTLLIVLLLFDIFAPICSLLAFEVQLTILELECCWL
jgi:hypothetical protein